MNRLTKVSSLLRVPPVGIGVAELSLDLGRVDIASILQPAVRFLEFFARAALKLRSNITNHARVLGLARSHRIGVLFVNHFLVGELGWQKASSLDRRESSAGSQSVAQSRSSHKSLQEHLQR